MDEFVMHRGEWMPAARVPSLRGSPTVRWGILAPGFIAGDFAATVLANTDQSITAVASRSPERAERFAAKYGIGATPRTYEELLARRDVDIVYIASPPSQHYEMGMLAISAGKHVLIEKPMATSAAQAQAIADSAQSAGVFAGEAMWTRYLPQFDVVQQLLQRGSLGDIRLATADVGWQVGSDGPARLFDPDQGGGSLLDMGIYGVWFTQFAIGRPELIRAVGIQTESKVDLQSVLALHGSDGRLGSVTTSMAVTNSGLASISGTAGSLRFTRPFVFPAAFEVHSLDNVIHRWEDNTGLTLREGLAWQAVAIAGYLREGLIDSPVHSLAKTIDVLHTIDQARAQLTS